MKASLVLGLLGACTQPALAVVHIPFTRHGSPPHDLTSRASKPRDVNQDFSLGALTYVVNVTIGTPGQTVSLALSTSSSDTWVLDYRSSKCTYTSTYWGTSDDDYTDYTESTEECIWGSCKLYTHSDGRPTRSRSRIFHAAGVPPGPMTIAESYCTGDGYILALHVLICFLVSSNVSSTYEPESPENDEGYSDPDYSSSTSYYDFDDYYPDGSYAEGSFFHDVFTLGDVSFDNFTVGLVNYTNRYIGYLGLGYNDSSHSSFTDRLVEEGLISSTTYSIWVDDAQASSGNILFGAIDTTKFEGTLSRVSSSFSGYKMLMPISSINATTKDSTDPISITFDYSDDTTYYSSSSSSSSSDDAMFNVVFSPPDPLSVLPDDVASQIWEIAGAYYDSTVEMATIGCNAGNDGSTTFSFRLGQGSSGPNISVALEDLIIPVTDVDLSSYSSYYFSGLDTDVCLFGVQNTSLGYSYTLGYSLGSSILRRTYSVFDFVNDEIAIAPVKFGATETSNIVAFETYGASAPSSTSYCTASYCSKSSSDGTSSNGDSDSDSDSDDLDGILSVPALIGTALGLGLGSLSLGIVGFLFWRRRRNIRMAAQKDAGASVYSVEGGEQAPALPPRGGPTASGAAPAPEMTQASQAAPQQPPPPPPPGSAKGKAPEIPMPENLASTSGHGPAHGVHESEPVAASSSRDA